MGKLISIMALFLELMKKWLSPWLAGVLSFPVRVREINARK